MWGCFVCEGENYNEDNEFLRYAAKAVPEELVDTNRLANWLLNCDEHHGGGCALVENLTFYFPCRCSLTLNHLFTLLMYKTVTAPATRQYVA